MVSVFASLGLGVAYNVPFLNETAIIVLCVFWLMLFLPVMLVVSSIMNAQKDAGHFIINLMSSAGLWFLGLFLTIIAATIF